MALFALFAIAAAMLRLTVGCSDDSLLLATGTVEDAATSIDSSAGDGGPGNDAGAPDGAASGSDGSGGSDASFDGGAIEAGPTLRSGALDTTFGGTGYVTRFHTSTTNSRDRANAVTIDSLGRIVVVGTTDGQVTHAAAWRLDGNGVFDATFGTGGAWWSVDTHFGPNGLTDEAYALYVDAQNRPVLAGHSSNDSAGYRTTAWRLTTGGALDPTFGGTGEVTSGDAGAGGGPNDEAYGVAHDALGNFFLGGLAQSPNGVNAQIALWKMTPDGMLDTSFGSPKGYALEWGAVDGGTPDNDVVQSVAIDHDGNIVLAGSAQDNESETWAGVQRFTSSGAVDTTFNGVGHVAFRQIAGVFAADQFDMANGVLVDAQNRIVFCGRSTVPTMYSAPYDARAFVGRLLPSGALDTSFGNQGFVILDPNPGGYYSWAHALAIDSQGRIVVAGESADLATWRVAAWRVLPSGALDTSFGDAGMFSVAHSAPPSDAGLGAYDRAFAVAIDPMDRAVLAGYADGPSTTVDRYMAVWRLTP
jgi:uncharacterized delta-60 repeat protein